MSEIEDIEFLLEQWLQNLASLEELRIEGCHRLKSLSLSLFMQHLTSLKTLFISECEEVDLFYDEDTQSVGVSPQITVLENLEISDCSNLISLPEGIGNLTALQELEISDFSCLVSLPEGIGNLTALPKLEIFYWPNLISLPEGIGSLTSLERFEVRSCHNLTSLPSGMHQLSSLQTLIITDCPHLKERYQKGIGEIAHVSDFQYRDSYYF